MSGVYIFIGPTIRPDEMQAEIQACFLPPVSQGDVLSLLRHKPDVIGIVDGYFERIPSVWHKEILQALEQGVYVVGAASMGALRAAELQPFGMAGVGRIFEWYRDGLIDADDEVAIVHAPLEMDFRPLSEALVNIRASLEAAQAAGIISPFTRSTLIEIAQGMPYPHRSYSALLKAAGGCDLPADEMTGLQVFLETSAVNQKKLDALALARHIRERGTSHQHMSGPVVVHQTTNLNELADRDIFLTQAGELRISPELLVNQAREHSPDFVGVYERSSTQGLLLRLARQLDIRVTGQEIDQGLEKFKQTRGLATEAGCAGWLEENLLTPDELRNLAEELALLAKLRDAFPPDNRDILNQLRIENQFSPIKNTVIAKSLINESENLHG